MVGTKFQLLIYNGFDFISQKAKILKKKEVLFSCLVALYPYWLRIVNFDSDFQGWSPGIPDPN